MEKYVAFRYIQKRVDEFLNKINIYVTPKKSEIKYVVTYIHSKNSSTLFLYISKYNILFHENIPYVWNGYMYPHI